MTESHPTCNIPTWQIRLWKYDEILEGRAHYLNLTPHHTQKLSRNIVGRKYY